MAVIGRELPLAARRALTAQLDGEVFLKLIEINHDDIDPIRVASSWETVTHDGEDYAPFPFAVAIPEDSPGDDPSVDLAITNIDRQITEAIAGIVLSRPTATLTIVSVSDPDTVLAGPWEFELRQSKTQKSILLGELALDDMGSEPDPGRTMNPTDFPGLYGGYEEWTPVGGIVPSGPGVPIAPARGFPAGSPHTPRRRRR